MVRVCCIADLHGQLPAETPECDLLLIAGDLAPLDDRPAAGFLAEQLEPWLRRQPAREIVAIAGNHDWFAAEERRRPRSLPWRYLANEVIELFGLKIVGSPCTPGPFGAFGRPEEELWRLWRTIPSDTDVLLVHSPPYGYLDGTLDGRHVGSRSLRERLADLPQLKLVCCGHVHESAGSLAIPGGPLVVNGSLVDTNYELAHEPILVDIPHTNPVPEEKGEER